VTVPAVLTAIVVDLVAVVAHRFIQKLLAQEILVTTPLQKDSQVEPRFSIQEMPPTKQVAVAVVQHKLALMRLRDVVEKVEMDSLLQLPEVL
jgi:hypothetical protein